MTTETLSLEQALEEGRWRCKCKEEFAEPEECASHVITLARKEPKRHGGDGFWVGDYQVMKQGFRGMYKGEWRAALERALRGEEPYPGQAGPGRPRKDGKGAEPVVDEDGVMAAPARPPNRQPQVRFQFRPQVFDVDESVIHLYHLAVASYTRLGVPYARTLGQWVREVVFRFHMEHEEILDLRAIFTPEELTFIREEYVHDHENGG